MSSDYDMAMRQTPVVSLSLSLSLSLGIIITVCAVDDVLNYRGMKYHPLT
jgi:hypothetical protein